MSPLRISDLSVCFPTGGIVKAVDGIDLNIEVTDKQKRIRTGCEKTAPGISIIRLIQSSTRTEGKIIYRGRDLLSLSEDDMRKARTKEIARRGEQIAEAIQLH